jgi:hypothetical protein
MAAAKAKDADELKDKTTANRFTRTFNFNEQAYGAFEKDLERRGSSPGQMFRKMIADYVAEQYINIDHLPESTVAELRKHAQEQRTHFQSAVDSAINEWASARTKKK